MYIYEDMATFLFWFPLILNPGLSLPSARKHHT